MPPSQNRRSQSQQELLDFRLGLSATLNGSNMKIVEAELQRLSKRSLNLNIDRKQIQEFANRAAGIGKMFKGMETQAAASIANYQNSMVSMVQQYTDAQDRFNKARAKGDEAGAAAQMQVLEQINTQMQEAENRAKKSVEAIKAAREYASEHGGKRGFINGGRAVAEGFTEVLNHAQSGDLSGFWKSLGSGFVKYLGHAAKGLDVRAGAAAAAGADASAMAGLAEAVGTLAASLAAVVGVGGAVVGAIMFMDKQQKEFNKTLLEGAGIGDFTYSQLNAGIDSMNDSLAASRKAALDVAYEFRGDAKELTALLGKLNDAGVRYQDMVKGTKSTEEATAALSQQLRMASVWSRALGVSSNEVIEASADMFMNFGMEQKQIESQFAAVADAAQMSGMNTKRFFTAVSQATSGMALYNVRMDEAAQLLSKTSHILGATNASEFIKGLTKGFGDDSQTERAKKILVAGGKDVSDIFKHDAARAANQFRKEFADQLGDSGVISKIFKGMGIDIGTTSQDMIGAFRKLSAEQQRALLTQLREQGEDKAAQQLEGFFDLARATKGGLREQVRAMDSLTMGGKLAMKLQTLGDKRLSDMSFEELAAFESYAGVSGEQLEELKRMDSAFQGQWEELQKFREQTKNGQELDAETAKRLQELYGVTIENGKIMKDGQDLTSFYQYVATQGDALTDVATVQDKATMFAREVASNTNSVADILQNGVQQVLNSIYDLLISWFGSTKSPEQLQAQRLALDANQARQEDARQGLSSLSRQLAAQQEIALTGGSRGERDAAKKEAERLNAQITAMKEQLTALTHEGQEIAAGRSLGSAGSADIYGSSQTTTRRVRRMGGSRGEDVDYIDVVDNTKLNEEQLAYLRNSDATQNSSLTLAERQAKVQADFQARYKSVTTEAFTDAFRRAEAERLATQLGYSGADLPAAVSEILKGSASTMAPEILSRLSSHPEYRETASGFGFTEPVAHDFIMRPGQKAQRFTSKDTVIGMKPGGAIDQAGLTGNTVVNNYINGGDLGKVYETVRQAVKAGQKR